MLWELQSAGTEGASIPAWPASPTGAPGANGPCAADQRRSCDAGIGVERRIERACKPIAAIQPREALAGAEVDELRPAAEPVEARLRAGQRPGEGPAAGEIEGLCAGKREGDDVLGVTLAVTVANPENAQIGSVDGGVEAVWRFLVRRIVSKLVEQR